MFPNTFGYSPSSKLKDRQLLRRKISGGADLQEIYTLGELLGKGNFGTVVKALHKETNVFWAIKIVDKQKAGTSRIQLVEREINILKLVQHPNIIYLDCVFESPKIIYLVFEICTSTLAKFFKLKKKRLEEVEALDIIRSLARALAYLHKNDIVHRDLKLENILIANKPEINERLHIKISDFGLSAIREGPGHEKMLHEFCGTLTYMAPEVIATKSYSQQCDVWSMGVIMYVLLFKSFPFFSYNEQKLCKLISTEKINISELPCSEEARNLLGKLLEKNPAFRITAAETEQHPWVLGLHVNFKSQSSNVLDMMRMWKHEMLENTKRNLDTFKSVQSTISSKDDSSLTDWEDSFVTSSDTDKLITRSYSLQTSNSSTSDEIKPSTSKGVPLAKSMIRSAVNFNTKSDSDSSIVDPKQFSSKESLDKLYRRSSKLPDFSYVEPKVNTNLKWRKNEQGKKK